MQQHEQATHHATCCAAQIKKAYRSLAQVFHPDKHVDDELRESAQAAFAKLQARHGGHQHNCVLRLLPAAAMPTSVACQLRIPAFTTSGGVRSAE